MCRVISLSLILSLCALLPAQSNLDSLYGIWEDSNNNDTIRANAYLDFIARGPFLRKPDSAVVLLEELYKFNADIGYYRGKADGLLVAGYNYFRIGDYPKALKSYNEGLKIAKEHDYRKILATILLRTGYIYHDNEDHKKALEYYQQSLKICEENGYTEGIPAIYNEFGSIYWSQSEYEKALEYYQKSIALNSQLGREIAKAAMYSNSGTVYLELGEFSEALENYQKAMNIYQQTEDRLGIAGTVVDLGRVHMDKGDIEKAMEHFERGLELSKEISDSQGMISCLMDMTSIYLDNGNYKKVIEQSQETLEIAERLGDIGSLEWSYEQLYQSYKAIGNLQKALIYHEQMLLYGDSVGSEEATIELQQMEFSKKALADSLVQAEKDVKLKMEHQLEVQEKDKNRNQAIGIGAFFLLLSIGFFFRWRHIKKSKAIIEKEKDRSEKLLLNILPSEIAEELKEKGEAAARDFEMVSILFSDFKGFTQMSSQLTAKELIGEINYCFKGFDMICEKYNIEKIKTIGDAYMAASGLPAQSENSVLNSILAALEMQSFIEDRLKTKRAKNEIAFEMRVGIHTGPVVAGIVGVKKFQYDIWGDTVNIASRMESNGEVGKVNISQFTYEHMKDNPNFTFESRGKVNVKGKGEMEMWFVDRVQKT